MKITEFYDYVDANSDPGVPLTFLSMDVEYGVPRYEEAPYHILPGELFSYDVEMRNRLLSPYFKLILKHDYENGFEITKETLLYDILYPYLDEYHRCFYVMYVYDENNEYYLEMLAYEGIWTKMECPERNVFYCQGNAWDKTNLGLLTGGDSCAVSLAY